MAKKKITTASRKSLKQTFADYLAIKAHNWSSIKAIEKSPLNYQYRLQNPIEDAPKLARGRAVHTAVLEPELFMQEYIVFPGKTRRGEAWDEFAAAHAAETILKQDEYDMAWGCANSIRKNPDVAAILCNGKSEQVFRWKDKTTGLRCKSRVDHQGEVLLDLKSTGTIDARVFGRLAAGLSYYGQLAMYRDGADHKGPVLIVAGEIKPPHEVAVFTLSEDDLYAGQELYRGYLKRIAECTTSGVWPGRYTERVPLEMPKYVFDDEDQEDDTYQIVESEEAA